MLCHIKVFYCLESDFGISDLTKVLRFRNRPYQRCVSFSTDLAQKNFPHSVCKPDMSKRKADTGVDGEKAKKVAPRKIPKLLKAKITALLAEQEVPVDTSTIKLILSEKWEFPDSPENKDKVWKGLKELVSEKKICRVGHLYHAGEGSAAQLALTPEDLEKAEEFDAAEKKRTDEKYTCQDCQCTDYYCQTGETVPGPEEGSTITKYKCLNSCYREFTVLVHGNKRVYKHGYQFDETTEVIV